MTANLSELGEVALREVAQDFFEDSFNIESGKQYAKKRLNEFAQGSEGVKKHFSGLSGVGWQEGLVLGAITGMGIAYNAGKDQIRILGTARLEFSKELASGNATFLIPTNIEPKKFAKEQRALASYLTLAIAHPKIYQLLGLKETPLKQDQIKVEGTLLSSLPYYQMSQRIPESLSTDSNSEKVRQSISRFLRTQLRIYLSYIGEDFNDDSAFSDFFLSWWQKDNFLNHYRGPRLIAMTIGNLLWNMQYPIDPETKTRLSLKEKVERCVQAAKFISELLTKSDKDKLYLDMIDPSGKLCNFVRMSEVYIDELRLAYEEEKNNSLNLDEVTTHAHRAARILNDNIFHIIYRKENQSEALSSYVNYLHLILKRNSSVFSVLHSESFKNITHPLINKVPSTIFDVLLVFCQLNKHQVKEFISRLKTLEPDSNIIKGFALTLESLYKNFIRPIYKSEKAELIRKACEGANYYAFTHFNVSHHSEIKEEARKRAFYQSMSLISMAANDYNLELDSQKFKLASQRSKMGLEPFFTCREQINEITRIAYENNLKDKIDRDYHNFGCDLSSYMSLPSVTEDEINTLVSKQYKIGQYTHLIATLKAFTNKYHDYLLEPQFKEFLISSLRKIKEEFGKLNELCTHMIQAIDVFKIKDRGLVGIVNNMSTDLSSEISSFMNEVETSTKKLNSELFEHNIKKEIMLNLKKIQKRFSAAFSDNEPELTNIKSLVSNLEKDLNEPKDKDSHDEEIIDEDFDSESDLSSSDGDPLESEASYYQIQKISGLILNCTNALSALSRDGVKGDQLRLIYDEFIRKPVYSMEDLQHAALDVCKVVCAYRPSFFFQAGYAKTRSATVLINEILSSIDDPDFSLYEWLLPSYNLDVTKLTREAVEQQLFTKKNVQIWPASTEQFIDSPVLHL